MEAVIVIVNCLARDDITPGKSASRLEFRNLPSGGAAAVSQTLWRFQGVTPTIPPNQMLMSDLG